MVFIYSYCVSYLPYHTYHRNMYRHMYTVYASSCTLCTVYMYMYIEDSLYLSRPILEEGSDGTNVPSSRGCHHHLCTGLLHERLQLSLHQRRQVNLIWWRIEEHVAMK